MKYRTLGRTGLSVSEVGFGTWALGSPVYGGVETNDAHTAIRGALDAGITFFDTAPLYGTKEEDGIAEKVLGKGLGSDRDRVTIATKFGRYPTKGHLNTFFHAEGVTTSVEDSLRRLGTDRLDVLFFHSPFGPEQIEDSVWQALEDLKTSGKVRAVGHSISLPEQTMGMAREWAGDGRIDVVQVVYSLMNRELETLINDLGTADIGVVARESLANGFLAGVFTPETTFAPGTINARYSRDEIVERVETANRYRDLLVRGDISSMPQAALRWVLDNPRVSTVLAGSRHVHEIVDCAGASEAASYTAAELAQARELHVKEFPPA
ncbi:aldo/keto reductase [Synoicihabitans lomoniglobus]|uniref:Aldo/keto reductase n=1 Tax=Synoicihabitans lomoniglobus TaxID=2909285 RepID=A0AAF0CPT8_9BACT|nr:aldo/keto reductase [Opitutaceae bacterium LMO-M01]WED65838.1 aldo/keto reductase [Opitutaceae bacterium LMO-M01]